MTLLTKKEALSAVILFIEIYCRETNSKDAKFVLNQLEQINFETGNNPLADWSKYLERAKIMQYPPKKQLKMSFK